MAKKVTSYLSVLFCPLRHQAPECHNAAAAIQYRGSQVGFGCKPGLAELGQTHSATLDAPTERPNLREP